MPVLGAFLAPHPPLIMPEVGKGEERKITDTVLAYKKIAQMAAELNPDTIVIISPHSVMYGDYFHISPGKSAIGSFAEFGVPQLLVRGDYDEQFVSALAKLCRSAGVPAGTLGERNSALDHGTMIPLRFLQEAGCKCRVVRIGLSGVSETLHYQLGQCIAHASTLLGRRLVIVASGDLSHKLLPEGPYGFAKEGPEFDRLVIDALRTADFLSLLQLPLDFCEAAAECGLRSLWIMAGTFDKRWISAKIYSYEGPFGVGYGVASFLPEGKSEARNIGEQLEKWKETERQKRMDAEDEYVRLARFSLETFIRTGKPAPLPKNVSLHLLQDQAGAFVSLKKDGRLRGCIGTILPTTECVAYEIMMNAVSAGVRDVRFSPIEAEELPDIVYSVDVLTEPEKIESVAELDVKRYGVIVESGNRRGLLLPDLAGVDTVEQQIDIAREKGNIKAGEKLDLYRFEVIRHK